MFLFHNLQLLYDNLSFGGSQLVACTAFPQTVLVGEGDDDLVLVHHVGHDVGTLDVNRVGIQVEAFAQSRYLVRHVFGALLGREASALGVEIEQRILIDHDRHALRDGTQRIDARSLFGQLYRIGGIGHELHLLELHSQVGFVQSGGGQLFANPDQRCRIGISLYFCGSGQTVCAQYVPHFVQHLSRQAGRYCQQQAKAEQMNLFHIHNNLLLGQCITFFQKRLQTYKMFLTFSNNAAHLPSGICLFVIYGIHPEAEP